ncbi:hypothetical protein ACROYT_G034534 [Oculina patagonica]
MNRFAYIAGSYLLIFKLIVNSASILDIFSADSSEKNPKDSNRCLVVHHAYVYMMNAMRSSGAKFLREYHLTCGPGCVLADGETITGILDSVIQAKPSYIILFGL